jgi:hypothetical protein
MRFGPRIDEDLAGRALSQRPRRGQADIRQHMLEREELLRAGIALEHAEPLMAKKLLQQGGIEQGDVRQLVRHVDDEARAVMAVKDGFVLLDEERERFARGVLCIGIGP